MRPAWTVELSLGRVADYHLLERLGRGGSGEVWLAERVDSFEDRKIRRQVALKVKQASPEEEGATELLREWMLSSAVSHRNVVKILDVGRWRGSVWYLALEYIEGLTFSQILRRMVERGAKVPLVPLHEMAIGLCRGLRAIHEAKGPDGHPLGLIHRDVKPSNAMVSVDGEVKVLDFGIVRVEMAPDLTQVGMVKGTPHYMAPEQHNRVSADLTPAVDLFAFGVTIFEVATGGELFDDRLDMALSQQKRSGLALERITAHKERLGALAPILVRCLEPRPADRYPSAAALEGELLAALRALPRDPDLSAFMAALQRGELPEGPLVDPAWKALVGSMDRPLWPPELVAEVEDGAESGAGPWTGVLHEAVAAPTVPAEERVLRTPPRDVSSPTIDPSPPEPTPPGRVVTPGARSEVARATPSVSLPPAPPTPAPSPPRVHSPPRVERPSPAPAASPRPNADRREEERSRRALLVVGGLLLLLLLVCVGVIVALSINVPGPTTNVAAKGGEQASMERVPEGAAGKACEDPDGDGFTTCGGEGDMDCGEGDPSRHPRATERCDGLDNDCDDFVPEEEQDGDRDGAVPCDPWVGATEPGARPLRGGDCDDADPARAPGLTERPGDGLDQDCDGQDLCYQDADGDGVGGKVAKQVELTSRCREPGLSAKTGDCDDMDGGVFPGQREVSNGKDDDCDGQVDEGAIEVTKGNGGEGEGEPPVLTPPTLVSTPGSYDRGQANIAIYLDGGAQCEFVTVHWRLEKAGAFGPLDRAFAYPTAPGAFNVSFNTGNKERGPLYYYLSCCPGTSRCREIVGSGPDAPHQVR